MCVSTGLYGRDLGLGLKKFALRIPLSSSFYVLDCIQFSCCPSHHRVKYVDSQKNLFIILIILLAAEGDTPFHDTKTASYLETAIVSVISFPRLTHSHTIHPVLDRPEDR